MRRDWMIRSHFGPMMFSYLRMVHIIFLVARPESGRTISVHEQPSPYQAKRRKVLVRHLQYNDEQRHELEAHQCIEIGCVGTIKALLKSTLLVLGARIVFTHQVLHRKEIIYRPCITTHCYLCGPSPLPESVNVTSR